MTVEEALKNARKFGATTIYDVIDDHQFYLHYTDLGRDMCGVFNKVGSCVQIGINNRLSSRKQEFVVAHEIGHALMHWHIKQLHCTKYSIYSRDVMEFEANKFAVLFLWSQNEYHSLEHFAAYHELEISVVKDMFGGRLGRSSIL